MGSILLLNSFLGFCLFIGNSSNNLVLVLRPCLLMYGLPNLPNQNYPRTQTVIHFLIMFYLTKKALAGFSAI